ncbi:uncharacterized protein [Panulirus ornatus]|uniref:uncharacterized protein n=1 Tax=Panulirus ornatus TaxID=150431 RepID=UPI003A8C00F3
MWMKWSVVAMVVASVASQTLVDFSKRDLQTTLRDQTFIPELVACAHCQSNTCRPLTRAIMNEMHLVINGCNTCTPENLALLQLFLPFVEKNHNQEYQMLRTTLGRGPVSC